ncbi:MAG: hypothetical protein ACLTUL_03270 [Blautia faecis]
MGMYDRDWYESPTKKRKKNTAGISVYIVSLKKHQKKKADKAKNYSTYQESTYQKFSPTKTQIKS